MEDQEKTTQDKDTTSGEKLVISGLEHHQDQVSRERASRKASPGIGSRPSSAAKEESGEEGDHDDELLMKVVAYRAKGEGNVPDQGHEPRNPLAPVRVHNQDRRLRGAPSEGKETSGVIPKFHGSSNEREVNPPPFLLRRGMAVGIRRDAFPGAYAESGSDSFVSREAQQYPEGEEPLSEVELARAWPISVPVAVSQEDPEARWSPEGLGGNSWICSKAIVLTGLVLFVYIANLWTPLIEKFQATNPATIRRQHIKTIIEEAFGKDYFHDEEKERALHWFVDDDPQQASAVNQGKEIGTNALIQRFSLAAFYFQTSSQQPWSSCNPPQKGQSSLCNFDLAHDYGGSTTGARWLSAAHECQWMGVYCQEGSTLVSEIVLRSNNMTGSIPPELSKLRHLRRLDLSCNSFTGLLPSWIEHLTSLEALSLYENKLSGRIPASYFSHPGLDRLRLEYNVLSGAIPSQVGAFCGNKIRLSANLLTGSIPEEIYSTPNLRQLFLDKNQISKRALTGPMRSLGFDLAYTTFSCSLLQITGTLSPRLGQLTALWTLFLDESEGLHGQIPSEIGLLTKLRYAEMGGCGFSGTIPEQLYGLTSLWTLLLGNTAISGTISSGLGQLTNLRWLSITGTHIGGRMPSEVSEITKLFHLDISGNPNLAGSMPDQLCHNLLLRSKVAADCTPTESTGIPAVLCPHSCCSTCCDAETGICTDN